MPLTRAEFEAKVTASAKAIQAGVRADRRGLAFVSLFAAAKQLVDNHPKRFPYLEYNVRLIERDGLAPPLERK